LLATKINLKEIRAVGIVLKSLGIFRKALKLAEVEELSALLPLDSTPAKPLTPDLEKKYHLTKTRYKFFTNTTEIKALLHLLYIMKLIDEHNVKEVFYYPEEMNDRLMY
jgi:hypothetical protein